MQERTAAGLSLIILRGAFLVLAVAVTLLYVLSEQEPQAADERVVIGILLVALLVVGLVIAGDIISPRKKLSAVSGVFLGLLVGLVLAYALSFFVDFIWLLAKPATVDEKRLQSLENLLQGVKIFIGLITCYVGISMVLQTKDDFRFVIPYVEFAKEIRGNRPTLLDSSVLIDGRIYELVQTRLLQGTLIIPRFILNEMQLLADSADRTRRMRGRRGLDIARSMQQIAGVDLMIDGEETEGSSIDQKLVNRAAELKARVMTNDHNLAKVAEVRGVSVVLLNEVAKALRPAIIVGEHLTIRLVKEGEVPGQGVGYLDDGAMVVLDQAADQIGNDVEFEVTRIIQTTAGRMVFGRPINDESSPDPQNG